MGLAGIARGTAGLALSMLSLVLAGCTLGSTVEGRPTIGPLPEHGHVDVTLALTDSFDVHTDGTCAGRHVFRGVANGASVEIRGENSSTFVNTTVLTRYQRDATRKAPYDDGQFCIVKFTFVPVKPDPAGYFIEFPLGPQLGYGFMITLMGESMTPPFGRGYGTYDTTIQTCTDYDAPPERPC